MEITFFRGLIPATFPALLGLILGAVVWIPLGWSQILPLQLVFVWLLPVFWAQSKTRASAFFLVFGYYLVASRDVPAMSQSFTSLSLFFAWLLILVYAGVIAVFWAVVRHRQSQPL